MLILDSLFTLLLAGTTGNLQPQTTPPAAPAPEATPAQRLVEEIQKRNRLMENLEYLCDEIGPRPTGSTRLRQAQAWCMKTLLASGADRVHEEAYPMGRPWVRGRDAGRVLGHNGVTFRLDHAAGTPGTDGPIEGEVVRLESFFPEDLSAFRGHLKGRIVLVDPGPACFQRLGQDEKGYITALGGLESFLASEGARIWMQSTQRAAGLAWTVDFRALKPGWRMPVAMLPQESWMMLKRQVTRGALRLSVALGGRIEPAATQAWNTVAEIQGSDLAGEVVILGAHLDSHDLGLGATDDGTGSMVALEVVRALRACGLKPRRTLRVVLWSGEEQGLMGSRAYAKAHAAELDKVQAVLVMDQGMGRIQGFRDRGVPGMAAWFKETFSPFPQLGLKAMTELGRDGDSDHWSFDPYGVPAFSASQDPRGNERTHHSQVDTPDQVSPAALTQSAQVMAVVTWNLLNQPGRLPRPQPTTH